MTLPTPSDDPLDQALDVLSHRHRRHIVTQLVDAEPDERVSIPGLTPPDSDTDTFLIDLHHRHLPKLTEAEFVVYDDETLTLSRGPQFRDVEGVHRALDAQGECLPGDWS